MGKQHSAGRDRADQTEERTGLQGEVSKVRPLLGAPQPRNYLFCIISAAQLMITNKAFKLLNMSVRMLDSIFKKAFQRKYLSTFLSFLNTNLLLLWLVSLLHLYCLFKPQFTGIFFNVWKALKRTFLIFMTALRHYRHYTIIYGLEINI